MSDDLTRIKDIGLAREKWLNDHGIGSYAELAAIDPLWLFEKLKDEGRPVPLGSINRWIKTAGEKLRDRVGVSQPDTGSVIPFQRVARVVRTEDGWEEFASFYVSYQRKHEVGADLTRTQVSYRTYADHIEANENREWAGIEGEGLCQWVMNHVTTIVGEGHVLGFESGTHNPRDEAAATIPSSPMVMIKRVSVGDDLGHCSTGYPEQRFDGWVMQGRPLRVECEVACRTAGSLGADPAACPVNVSLAVHELATGREVVSPIVHTLQFTLNDTTGGLRFAQNMTLSEGLYYLRIIARTLSYPPAWVVAEISLLQVI